jgi:hypothetical protein
MKGVETEADGDRGRGRRLHDEHGLEDVADGPAWIAYEQDGAPLDPAHGGFGGKLVAGRRERDGEQ